MCADYLFAKIKKSFESAEMPPDSYLDCVKYLATDYRIKKNRDNPPKSLSSACHLSFQIYPCFLSQIKKILTFFCF